MRTKSIPNGIIGDLQPCNALREGTQKTAEAVDPQPRRQEQGERTNNDPLRARFFLAVTGLLLRKLEGGIVLQHRQHLLSKQLEAAL
jgi:hypothetical protein